MANTEPYLTTAETGIDLTRLQEFASRLLSRSREDVQLDVRVLRGGLQATGVAHVRTRAGDARGGFIVKCLPAAQQRKAMLYKSLARHGADWLAPRLLGSEPVNNQHSYLYLESINAWRRWPWQNVSTAGLILDALAWIHVNLPIERPYINPLYETQLEQSAAATFELFEHAVREPCLARFARLRPTLRRLVERLTKIRRTLMSHQAAVLHGDVHSGNAFVRLRGGNLEPVLIDWQNVRIGSPLEDVASWLQSLAYWEPQVRRRHDTLLKRYLQARGLQANLTRELRDHYWLAAACNALAGALHYHLSLASCLRRCARQCDARVGAVRDWLRIIRRADECWGP